MVQTEITIYDATIHSNPDVQIWAKFFMEVFIY